MEISLVGKNIEFSTDSGTYKALIVSLHKEKHNISWYQGVIRESFNSAIIINCDLSFGKITWMPGFCAQREFNHDSEITERITVLDFEKIS